MVSRWRIALLVVVGLAVLLIPAALLAPAGNGGGGRLIIPRGANFTVGPMARAQGATRRLPQVWGILLHSTEGVPRGDLRLLSRSSRVSVHFLVMPDGHIRQLVPLARVAFHAGSGELGGHSGNLNEGLVGIEVSNPSKPGRDFPYPAVQLKAVDQVIKIIDRRLGRRVPIFGHKDVVRYPGGWRKTDPEGAFPLRAYKLYRRHSRP